jgi:hypothetical protein
MPSSELLHDPFAIIDDYETLKLRTLRSLEVHYILSSRHTERNLGSVLLFDFNAFKLHFTGEEKPTDKVIKTPPMLDITGIQVNNITSKWAEVELYMTFVNPLPISMKVDQLFVEVQRDGIIFMNGSIDGPYDLKYKENKNITLKGILYYSKISGTTINDILFHNRFRLDFLMELNGVKVKFPLYMRKMPLQAGIIDGASYPSVDAIIKKIGMHIAQTNNAVFPLFLHLKRFPFDVYLKSASLQCTNSPRSEYIQDIVTAKYEETPKFEFFRMLAREPANSSAKLPVNAEFELSRAWKEKKFAYELAHDVPHYEGICIVARGRINLNVLKPQSEFARLTAEDDLNGIESTRVLYETFPIELTLNEQIGTEPPSVQYQMGVVYDSCDKFSNCLPRYRSADVDSVVVMRENSKVNSAEMDVKSSSLKINTPIQLYTSFMLKYMNFNLESRRRLSFKLENTTYFDITMQKTNFWNSLGNLAVTFDVYDRRTNSTKIFKQSVNAPYLSSMVNLTIRYSSADQMVIIRYDYSFERGPLFKMLKFNVNFFEEFRTVNPTGRFTLEVTNSRKSEKDLREAFSLAYAMPNIKKSRILFSNQRFEYHKSNEFIFQIVDACSHPLNLVLGKEKDTLSKLKFKIYKSDDKEDEAAIEKVESLQHKGFIKVTFKANFPGLYFVNASMDYMKRRYEHNVGKFYVL